MDSRYYDAANGILKCDAEREALLKTFSRSFPKVAVAVVGQDFPTEIDQAIEFWKQVRAFPERAFETLKKVRERATGVKVFHSEHAQLRYDVFVLRLAYLRRYENHANRYVRLVANLESLRTPVLRRLFWFANVDFQSSGSFFKRITPEQEEAIAEHAKISYRFMLSEENVDFPCFTEGFANAVANKFQTREITIANRVGNGEEDESRYSSKSAIAHNLFGWDFGFQLYSDADAEFKNPTSLPGQTVLSFRGEDFSVNTESRGIYWWLYKTIRSNNLWGSDDVTLRAHVCPGFWATVFLWAFLLVGSPSSFVAGILNFDELFGKILLAPGAVTPLLAGAIGYSWFMKKFGKGYDKKFAVGSLLVAVVTLVVSVIGTAIFDLLKWMDWTEPVNWLIVLFLPMWAGYSLSREKGVAPWQLPIIGPLFLSAIAVRATWIGYTQHTEEFFTVLKYAAMGIATLLAAGVCLFAGYMAIQLLKWLSNKMCASSSNTKGRAIEYVRSGEVEKALRFIGNERLRSIVSMTLGCLGFAFLLGTSLSVATSGMGVEFVLPIVALSLYVSGIFGIMAWYGLSSAYEFAPTNFDREVVENIIGFHDSPAIRLAIVRNQTFRRKDKSFDEDVINKFVSCDNFKKCWWRMDENEMADMIASCTPSGVEHFMKAKTKTYLLPYVAKGLRYGKARLAYRRDVENMENERIRLLEEAKKRREAQMNAKETLMDTLLYLPRAIGAAVSTVGLLKKTFDNHCPHIYRSKRVV